MEKGTIKQLMEASKTMFLQQLSNSETLEKTLSDVLESIQKLIADESVKNDIGQENHMKLYEEWMTEALALAKQHSEDTLRQAEEKIAKMQMEGYGRRFAAKLLFSEEC